MLLLTANSKTTKKITTVSDHRIKLQFANTTVHTEITSNYLT